MSDKNCVVRGRTSPDGEDMFLKINPDGTKIFVKDVNEATVFTGDEADQVRRRTLCWQGVVVLKKDTNYLV